MTPEERQAYRAQVDAELAAAKAQAEEDKAKMDNIKVALQADIIDHAEAIKLTRDVYKDRQD
jgi:hypothetical protein